MLTGTPTSQSWFWEYDSVVLPQFWWQWDAEKRCPGEFLPLWVATDLRPEAKPANDPLENILYATSVGVEHPAALISGPGVLDSLVLEHLEHLELE